MIEELDSRHLEDSCSQDNRSQQYSSVHAWKPQKLMAQHQSKNKGPRARYLHPQGLAQSSGSKDPEWGCAETGGPSVPSCGEVPPLPLIFPARNSGMPFMLSPSHMWGFSVNTFTDTLECHTPPAMQPCLYLGRSILKLTTTASYLEMEGSPWYWSSWMMQARSFRRNSHPWM